MVSGVGGTPPFPSKSPEDVLGHLANAFKSSIGDFSSEVREIMINPHLADSAQILENFSQSIGNLNNLSKQASQQ
jgi:hypothetical protein